MNSQALPPEYRKAYEVINNILSNNIENEKLNTAIPIDILKAGTIVFIGKDFKSRNIPSGTHWSWNQVKAKKIANIQNAHGEFVIEFFKLMSRPVQNVPYKLWRFNVTKFDRGAQKTVFRVLWCEKGDLIDVQDFEFLSTFMEPCVANELWPKRKL